MIGQDLLIPTLTLMRPTSTGLSLDFAAGSYRSGGVALGALANVPGWSFSRTGAGMALTSAGGVTTFASGVARVTDRGLLLETPARTNLLAYSQAFETTSAYTARSGCTVPVTNLAAPDGSAAARRLSNAGNSNANEGLFANVTGIANGGYVLTLFARAGSLSSMKMVLKNANSDTVKAQQAFALTSQWQRFELAGVTDGAATGFRAEITTNGATGTVDLWQADVQAGAVGSSPIATTGATSTRGADSASITVPVGCTRWAATYGSAGTSSGSGLTAGAAFDLMSGRPWIGMGSELRTLEFLP